MAFNVQQFRTALQFEGARPSLFEVTMTFPGDAVRPPVSPIGGAGGAQATPGMDVTFKARAATLPGDSLSHISVNYFGREIKVAGTRTFPEWTMTIINDEDFMVRNSLEWWMNNINAHVANVRTPAFIRGNGGYQTDIFVKQFAKTSPPSGPVPMVPGVGTVVKEYQLVGAFPTDVSPIDLNWGDGDSIEEFTVTFAYQWWQSVVAVETTDRI